MGGLELEKMLWVGKILWMNLSGQNFQGGLMWTCMGNILWMHRNVCIGVNPYTYTISTLGFNGPKIIGRQHLISAQNFMDEQNFIVTQNIMYGQNFKLNKILWITKNT